LAFAEFVLESLLQMVRCRELKNQVGNKVNFHMDTISDMLTRIRNAYLRGHNSLVLPHSKLKLEILKVIVKHGYLKKVTETKDEKGKKALEVQLKYIDDAPAIIGIERISKPGQRIYSDHNGFLEVGGRRGMIVVSTSKGVLPHWEARKQKAGGEVLCKVF